MGCSQIILRKRSRETRVYDIVVYHDMPRAAVVSEILDVIVDSLTDEELEEIGSLEVPLEVAPVEEWVINAEAVTYNDGTLVPIGKIVQGAIGGGNDGYTYTIRVLYERDDDPGPHEATVMLRVRDDV